jgi:autotransporter-associated beta strand protein
LNQVGNQVTANSSWGNDFNVNTPITVTQLGVFDFGRDGLAASHNVYIYNRNTQQALVTVNIAAGNSGTLSADGYRFVSLQNSLTLPVGNYSVVADFSTSDKILFAGQFDGNLGVLNDGGSTVSYIGSGRSGSIGSYPTSVSNGPAYHYAAGNFIFNSTGSSRIPGDVTINGSTAVLDLGNNQNGNVATVTLDGGGSITGTGTSTLFSRTSFQMKSGSVGAIFGGAGLPLVKSTSGTVTLLGTNTYTGGTTINGGTLAVNGSIVGNATVNSGGTLQGTGTIGGSVSVAAGGILSPGNSPGVLTMDSATLATGSQTNIELGGITLGSQYDQVHATGTISLGGTLNVSLINNFTPSVGAAFTVLNASNLSNLFSALSLPSLPPTEGWDTTRLYTSGILSIASSNLLPGDWNRDHQVTAADLPIMLQALVDLPTYQATRGVSDSDLIAIGDLDHSNTVNNADIQGILFLLSHGLSNAPTPAPAPVPEPSTVVLLAIGAMIATISHSRSRSFERCTCVSWLRRAHEHPSFRIGFRNQCHALLSYKARCDYLLLRVGPERAIVERGQRLVDRRRTGGARRAKIWSTLVSLLYYHGR